MEGFAVTCPLAPDVPRLISGFCSSPRSFGFGFLQTPPHDDALAVPLAFGSAKTWLPDFHRHSYVPCPAHTFARMSGTMRLMAELIYGTGMRIGECVTLRVKDIDFDHHSITVRAGKGNKDRTTLMPEALIPDLRNHLTKVAQLHKSDVLQGNGFAPMPNALYRKYPSASQSLGWQFVFPSKVLRPWRDTNHQARWHCSPSTLRKAFNRAARQANFCEAYRCTHVAAQLCESSTRLWH